MADRLPPVRPAAHRRLAQRSDLSDVRRDRLRIHKIDTEEGKYLAEFLKLPAAAGADHILAAISCGAVFMGANTYIGNGPNFMVKAIAEENNVKMPGFFGYMAYSCGILVPIFVAVTFVFFR